jgi:hypothetical protein
VQAALGYAGSGHEEDVGLLPPTPSATHAATIAATLVKRPAHDTPSSPCHRLLRRRPAHPRKPPTRFGRVDGSTGPRNSRGALDIGPAATPARSRPQVLVPQSSTRALADSSCQQPRDAAARETAKSSRSSEAPSPTRGQPQPPGRPQPAPRHPCRSRRRRRHHPRPARTRDQPRAGRDAGPADPLALSERAAELAVTFARFALPEVVSAVPTAVPRSSTSSVERALDRTAPCRRRPRPRRTV